MAVNVVVPVEMSQNSSHVQMINTGIIYLIIEVTLCEI